MSKETHLATVRAIRTELLQLLEGMDYCLDWKPAPSDWSVKEIVYHLLDTPPGGIHTVALGVLSGEVGEFSLWSDLTNMDAERQGHDMARVVEDLNGLFRGLEQAIESTDDDGLSSKPVMVHQVNRGWDEPRTLDSLLEGVFARHWREHLAQIRELRDSLGM